MTIQIVQICDGCRRSRSLNVDLKGGRETIEHAANLGWKEVDSDYHKHLCTTCIKNALSQK